MEKLKFVLKIWSKLANNVRMRDRSVKILQYGCQMLLGFYANQFSKVGFEIIYILCCTLSNKLYASFAGSGSRA